MTERLPYDPENPPWVKSYDPHVPPRVEVPDQALHEMLLATAEKYPDRPAATFMGETLSYARLAEETRRLASGLKRLGVGEGDRVALILPNTPHFITASYAAMMLGAAAVLFNPLWSPVQVREELEKIEPRAVVVLDMLLEKLSEYRGPAKIVVAGIGDYGGPGFRAKTLLGRLLGRIPGPPRGAVAYRELLRSPPAEPARVDPRETIAAMLYTGGTTGKPKAVMLTHRNIMANIVYQRVWFNRREASDTVLGLLPFFHAYGFGSILGLSINIAAHLILVPRFEPGRLVDTIVRHRINLVPGAPPVYTMLLRRVPEEKLARLRGVAEICFSGAAPLPVEVMERWERITGCKIVEGYGLTETSPVVAANPVYGKRKPGSIGLPMPNTLLAIADPAEPRLIGLEERGELVVSGEQVMKGYYKMPEENEKVFFECCGRRWLRTGDIAYMDQEGYFYIVDRKKDIIKYKGHSVYPRYVEEVLYQHPCVAEAAVIGVPDPEAGENIKAFIVLRDECRGRVSERDIVEWSRQRLGAHEYPRLVEFVDDLPKSAAGKVLRRLLRERELARLKRGEKNA